MATGTGSTLGRFSSDARDVPASPRKSTWCVSPPDERLTTSPTRGRVGKPPGSRPIGSRETPSTSEGRLSHGMEANPGGRRPSGGIVTPRMPGVAPRDPRDPPGDSLEKSVLA